MKDIAEKSAEESTESPEEASSKERSRLNALLADTQAKLRLTEYERDRAELALARASKRLDEQARTPLYRVFEKLRALDSARLSWRLFYLLRGVRRANIRYGRAFSRLGARLEYVPFFFARSAPKAGENFFSELVPASDLPRKIVRLRGAGVVYTYSFTCGFEGLSQVSLLVDVSAVTSTCDMEVRVELGGVVIHEERRVVSDGRGQRLVSFCFAPISRSIGKQCVVTVSSPTGSVREYVGVVLFGDRPSKLPALAVQSEVDLGSRSREAGFAPYYSAESVTVGYTRSLGWKEPSSKAHLAPLYGDRIISFSFQAPKEPLSAIEVFFNSAGRFSYTDVCVAVDRDGGRVWEGAFSTRLLEDVERFSLPIPRSVLDELRGRFVTVSLSSPTAASDQFVFVRGALVSAPRSSPIEELKTVSVVNQITRFPLDSALGAPVFREALRDPSHRLRIAMLEGPSSTRDEVRPVLLTIFSDLMAAGHDCIIYPQAELPTLVSELRDVDVLILPDQDYSEVLREIVTEIRMSYGIVIGLSHGEPRPSKLLEACSAVLSASSILEKSTDLISDVVAAHRKTHDLSVSIVTVLYRKEREIPLFLKCLARQDFSGISELVVVNDCSPDQSREMLIKCYEELREQGYSLPSLKIIDNEANSGNCASRNRALESVTGDVVVIVDADCLLNDNFLSAHVHSHIFHNASVVIGPCNLESGLADPIARLKEYERSPERVEREAELQDPINLDSFVNCITRNFSIRRTDISEDLFDELFGYSASPDSGFGWEDVEMGYRLYKRGLKIHFNSQAISVHVTHPSTTEDRIKPIKSLKNFRRLIEKHPEIALDARRWFQDTFEKIERWSASCGHLVNEDQRAIREKLAGVYPYPFAIKRNRELRVVTYRWHVPHQYELYKLPHRFTLLRGLGTGFTNDWLREQRPMPRNAMFVPVEKFNVRDADVAILHFDENVLRPENCNGVISRDWGDNFRYFMDRFKGVPKVAVCHGTPQFIGQYNPSYSGDDLGTPIESSRAELVRFLKDVPVVCNSHQALREWGFKNARVIWHGFDPSEFQITDYDGGILTLGSAMKERPYYRGYAHYLKVCEMLPPEFRPEYHSVNRPPLGITNSQRYAQLKFDEYRKSIRRYSVYFNPTIRSPMPRSRGEAMMSGLVTVSAANHDVELFIKNGWNGFYAANAEEMAEHLLFLMRNKRACREMGLRSRQTAADVFNHDRYLHAWQSLLTELVGA